MDAERAWSHAMELKLLANTELRKKFHYIRRLRKAANHADQLQGLCDGEACDARTKLESQVKLPKYVLCMDNIIFVILSIQHYLHT